MIEIVLGIPEFSLFSKYSVNIISKSGACISINQSYHTMLLITTSEYEKVKLHLCLTKHHIVRRTEGVEV
jgi:hypothetical protein